MVESLSYFIMIMIMMWIKMSSILCFIQSAAFSAVVVFFLKCINGDFYEVIQSSDGDQLNNQFINTVDCVVGISD